MSIPTSGPFRSILDGYLGYLPAAQQQKVWNKFLAQNDLTSAPTDTDVDQLVNFSTYISRVYESTITPATSDAGKTRIVLSLFDIIITLMQSMNDAAKVMSDNVAFFVKKQKEYLDAATSAPVYQGYEPLGKDPVSGIKYNVDPAQYLLGYNNMTMKDVLEYLDSPLIHDDKGNIVDITTVAPPFPKDTMGNDIIPNIKRMKMPLHPQTNPPQYLDIKIDRGTPTGIYQFTADLVDSNGEVILRREGDFIDTTLPLENRVAAMGGFLATLYNASPILKSNAPGLPWAVFKGYLKGTNTSVFKDVRYTFANPGTQSIDLGTATSYDKNTQYALATQVARASANAYLQTAIDALKTKKDILADIADSSQKTVTSSSQGLQQMANIYKALITNLNNIMNAIFK